MAHRKNIAVGIVLTAASIMGLLIFSSIAGASSGSATIYGSGGIHLSLPPTICPNQSQNKCADVTWNSYLPLDVFVTDATDTTKKYEAFLQQGLPNGGSVQGKDVQVDSIKTWVP